LNDDNNNYNADNGDNGKEVSAIAVDGNDIICRSSLFDGDYLLPKKFIPYLPSATLQAKKDKLFSCILGVSMGYQSHDQHILGAQSEG
jgi:hypothetical protein